MIYTDQPLTNDPFGPRIETSFSVTPDDDFGGEPEVQAEVRISDRNGQVTQDYGWFPNSSAAEQAEAIGNLSTVIHALSDLHERMCKTALGLE